MASIKCCTFCVEERELRLPHGVPAAFGGRSGGDGRSVSQYSHFGKSGWFLELLKQFTHFQNLELAT